MGSAIVWEGDRGGIARYGTGVLARRQTSAMSRLEGLKENAGECRSRRCMRE